MKLNSQLISIRWHYNTVISIKRIAHFSHSFLSVTLLPLFRSRRRCCPCRMSALSESGLCSSTKLEKLSPSTQKACAWVLVTWLWAASLLRLTIRVTPTLPHPDPGAGRPVPCPAQAASGATASKTQWRHPLGAVKTVQPASAKESKSLTEREIERGI